MVLNIVLQYVESPASFLALAAEHLGIAGAIVDGHAAVHRSIERRLAGAENSEISAEPQTRQWDERPARGPEQCFIQGAAGLNTVRVSIAKEIMAA